MSEQPLQSSLDVTPPPARDNSPSFYRTHRDAIGWTLALLCLSVLLWNLLGMRDGFSLWNAAVALASLVLGADEIRGVRARARARAKRAARG